MNAKGVLGNEDIRIIEDMTLREIADELNIPVVSMSTLVEELYRVYEAGRMKGIEEGKLIERDPKNEEIFLKPKELE